MSQATKFLLFAAGLLLTIGLIVFGFKAYDAGKSTSNDAITKFDDVIANVDGVSVSQFKKDGTVSGSDISALIEGISDANVIVKVTTNAGSEATYENDSKTLPSKSSANYINPNSSFKCTAISTAGEVTTISFKQR